MMISKARCIYSNPERFYEGSLQKLANCGLIDGNKQFIHNFHIYLTSKGLSKIRRGKLLHQALKLTEIFEKKFLKCLLSDIDRHKLLVVVSEINDMSDKAQATKADYCRCLKQMFKWYELEDPRFTSNITEQREVARKFYEAVKRDLKTSYKAQQINPSDIISEQDIILVSEKGCINPKERAFIWTLHETGCRAAEFLNLKIGDVDFKSHYAVLQIPDGKTGRRQLYIRNSVFALRYHIENHPRKDDRSAYLWVSDATNNRGEPLLHRGAQAMVARCFIRAGLIKKHNLHWFRHSRATILAPKLTEAMLCKYMGWILGSDMVRTYAHLCTQDVEHSFLQMHGLETEKTSVKPQPCDCCNYLNPNTAKYCGRCNKPLSLAVVITDQELVKSENNDRLRDMLSALSDPAINAKFQQFLAQNAGRYNQ